MRSDPEFYEYRRAAEILALLRRCLHARRRERVNLNVLLTGPSGSGKTAILQEFLRRHPPRPNPDGERAHIPVLFLDTPPHPDLRQLFDHLLHQLRAPSNWRFSKTTKTQQLRAILARTRTRVLMLDDIGHALPGHGARARAFLVSLLSFATGCGLSLVLATAGERATTLIEKHASLRQRLRVILLPRFELVPEFERACEALAEFRKMEPKLSAAELHRRSDGLIGLLTDVFEDAYQAGLKAGTTERRSRGSEPQ